MIPTSPTDTTTIVHGLDDLVELAGRAAADKGWHDRPVTLGERLALIHSEVSEALEAYRDRGDVVPALREDGKPEGVPSELADVLIRVADLAYVEGIDLADAVARKLAYNATRPHRHGGKHL